MTLTTTIVRACRAAPACRRSSSRPSSRRRSRPRPAASPETPCGCSSPDAVTTRSCTRRSPSSPASSTTATSWWSTRRARWPLRSSGTDGARPGHSRCTCRRSCPPGCGPWSCVAPAPRCLDAAGGCRGRASTAGGTITLLAPYAPHPRGVRLWVARGRNPRSLSSPTWPCTAGPSATGTSGGAGRISTYQNVYATEPGSAEMPSAGPPFHPRGPHPTSSPGGWASAPVVLHTGVASLEASEPPYPEYYRVTRATAHRVNDTRREGGRVLAVGTTVVRCPRDRGRRPGRGPCRPRVDRHGRDPRPPRDRRWTACSPAGTNPRPRTWPCWRPSPAGSCSSDSYAAALAEGYLWHEFGDVHLVLP